MKGVLISIRPKWVEKIASGEKTIEVRKTAPKEVPFKAYIYCTKDKYEWLYRVDNNGYGKPQSWHGKVIGEFVCDKVYKWECKNRLEILESFPIWRASYMLFVDDLKKTCLTYDELEEYGKGKTLYGWHISDLKIYDEPKELGEFKKTKEKIVMTCGMHARNGLCRAIDHEELCDNIKCCFKTPRPSQSWCYVEELEK